MRISEDPGTLRPSVKFSLLSGWWNVKWPSGPLCYCPNVESSSQLYLRWDLLGLRDTCLPDPSSVLKWQPCFSLSPPLLSVGGDNGSVSFSWKPSKLFCIAAMETKHRYSFHLPPLAIKRQARIVSPRCSENQPGTYPFLKILIEGNSCTFVGKPSASGTEHRLDN